MQASLAAALIIGGTTMARLSSFHPHFYYYGVVSDHRFLPSNIVKYWKCG